MVQKVYIRAISNPEKKASTVIIGDHKATVKVCKDDKFDKEFGILIAWVKAIDPHYKSYFNDYNHETEIPSNWDYLPYSIIGGCKEFLYSNFGSMPYKVKYKEKATVVEFAFGAFRQEVETTGDRMKDFFLAYLYNIYGKNFVNKVLQNIEVEKKKEKKKDTTNTTTKS